MPLFILTLSNNGNYAFRAYDDLYTIVYGDPLLTTEYWDSNMDEVLYSQGIPGVGPNLVDQIVNDVDQNVIIAAFDSNAQYGGVSFTENPLNVDYGIDPVTGERDTNTIYVLYDAFNCNGDYWWVQGGDLGWISLSSALILFDGLTIAYLLAQGIDFNQYDIIVAENDFRIDLGLPIHHPEALILSCGVPDIGGNGEVPGEATPSTPSGKEEWGRCFIATAALSGSEDPMVASYLRLRDAVIRRSAFGELFFDRIFQEYDQFSPRIARDMHANQRLCQAIRWFLVVPLLNAYSLMSRSVGLSCESSRLSNTEAKPRLEIDSRRWKSISGHTLEIEARTFLSNFYLAGFTPEDVAIIQQESVKLAMEVKMFEQQGCAADQKPPKDPNQPEATFRYVAACISAASEAVTYTEWALIRPLEMFWDLALCFQSSPANTKMNFDGWFVEWWDERPLRLLSYGFCRDTVSWGRI